VEWGGSFWIYEEGTQLVAPRMADKYTDVDEGREFSQ
jgi:hypothetical protein